MPGLLELQAVRDGVVHGRCGAGEGLGAEADHTVELALELIEELGVVSHARLLDPGRCDPSSI